MTADAGERYMKLVTDHPLLPLRDEGRYQASLKEVARLLKKGASRDADETGYLEVLAMLVERYEEERDPRNELRGVDFLKHLLEANALPQRAIAMELGGESVVSQVLSGRRNLNAGQIARLAGRFGVPPGLFISPAAAKRA